MYDCMKPHVPEFRKALETDGECMFFHCVSVIICPLKTGYLEMQDLLRDFDNPNVMDIKMGIRYKLLKM